MRTAIIGFLVLAVITGVIGVFWYLTSPYYTLQEIGVSLQNRDSEKFYRLVDVQTIITSLTSEIISEPALKTPRLSGFQMTIVTSAIGLGKESIDRAFVNRIDRYFNPSIRSCVPSDLQIVPPDANSNHDSMGLIAEQNTEEYTLADNGGESIGQFAKELGRELTGETAQLKRQVYQRMIHHAENHRDTFIGAIFAAPTRGLPMQEMCDQYGFDLKQIKGLTFGGSDTEQTGTVTFYSPKVKRNVSLYFDLTRPGGDMFVPWQIRKFRDLRLTFLDLGEDTDSQVQEMIAYSVAGMTQQNVFKETGGVLKRLSRSNAAKNLLETIKGKFR